MTTAEPKQGILFSGEMVRAILEGRKTQTRRFCHESGPSHPFWGHGGYVPCHQEGCVWSFRDVYRKTRAPLAPFFKSRYQPGELVYIKETWAVACMTDRERIESVESGEGETLFYRADWPEKNVQPSIERWRPSIHLPRWASRIHLRIADVRVERLQEISEEDAKAEGVTPENAATYGLPGAHQNAYAELWDSISPDHPWASNPWVFIYSFERVK